MPLTEKQQSITPMPQLNNRKKGQPSTPTSHAIPYQPKVSLSRESSFRARSSILDLERLVNDKDEFRGFFVLFWVIMGFYLILTAINNIQAKGRPFGLDTFKAMHTNFLHLVRDDLMIVSSLSYGLVLAYLQKWNMVQSRYVRLAIQHSTQLWFLVGWCWWIWTRNLPWVQCTSLTLHTIAMMFKMHSYNATIGDLNDKLRTFHAIEREYKALEVQASASPKQLSILKDQMISLNTQLCPNGNVRFPENVTVANFVDYILVPAFVYEVEYPRTSHIRWFYVLQKVFATFACMMLMYITIEHYIFPVLRTIQQITFISCVLKLIFPCVLLYLITFYIMFECVTNGFAELTRFADRNFYDDWWNSTSFDDFARKWNKPVHVFLFRHIYRELITNYSVSKKSARFITFLFSSCLHELAMIIIARRVRMYLFVLQMFQLPLIWISQLKWMQERPIIANAFFWFSLIAGTPLLAVCYLWEHFNY